MNGNDIEHWSEIHFGILALLRTILGFLNVGLGIIVVSKLFDWI